MVLAMGRFVRMGEAEFEASPVGLALPSDEAVRFSLVMVVALDSFKVSTNLEAEKFTALFRRVLLSPTEPVSSAGTVLLPSSCPSSLSVTTRRLSLGLLVRSRRAVLLFSRRGGASLSWSPMFQSWH